MLTKNAWEDLLLGISFAKEHPRAYADWEITDMYINLIVLIALTPLGILVDIVLAPFEISFYFFEKYIRGK